LQVNDFRQLALDELESVHRMALHLARNADMAGDLVQETYLRAFRAEKTFELRESGIKPWLFKILHNVFYTAIGKKRREPTLAEDMRHEAAASELDSPAPCWDLASLNWDYVDERLKHAIDDLDPRYRSVLLLWAVEGMKYREVADLLEIPLGTVMSRLYRARAILSESLGELAQEYGIASDV
jgi:RNA polymerase sigma-70 factor (ECF subfamily)